MDCKHEFLVGGIVEGESGRLRLIGRCCDEMIRIGDFFESVYDYEDTVDADGHELAHRVNSVAVRLRVVGINAYGHELQALGEGMTGALDLEGSGQELVRPGLVMGGELVAANGQAQPTDAKSTRSS